MAQAARCAQGSVLELEGEQLVSVPLGHTDTDSTTCLHAPSIGLAVCGDALYNDVHLHLGESDAEGRKEWIAALDMIGSLKPVAVIAGHKRPGAPDTPNNIEATRKYIRDFDRIASQTKTALELYNEMLAIYPERVNPFTFDNAELCDHYSAGDPGGLILSRQMARAWTSFARTGNPNHSGMPHWPAYTADTRATMYFDTPCAVRNNPEGNGLRIITNSPK